MPQGVAKAAPSSARRSFSPPDAFALAKGRYKPLAPLLIAADGADDSTPARHCEALVRGQGRRADRACRRIPGPRIAGSTWNSRAGTAFPVEFGFRIFRRFPPAFRALGSWTFRIVSTSS